LAQEAAQSGTDWTTVIVAALGFAATAAAAIIPALMARRDRNRDRQVEQSRQLRDDAAAPLGDAMGILNSVEFWLSETRTDLRLYRPLRQEVGVRRSEADDARPQLRHLAGRWPEAADDIMIVERYLGQMPNHLSVMADIYEVDSEVTQTALENLVTGLQPLYAESVDALDRLYDLLPPRTDQTGGS
jgi:hypothetical protein